MKVKETLENQGTRGDTTNRIVFMYNGAAKIMTIDAIKQALTQQEKKDELLGLYREKEKLAHNPYNNTTNEIRPFYEWACELSSLETKIQALEEEMK